ncbi:hypothetical protein KBD08_00720 [Candidatus Babeliales bacterium]|nr:hypothetical protein [Candidatus Babeliales bacterium]
MTSKCLSLNLILFFCSHTIKASQQPVEPYVPSFNSSGPFTRMTQNGTRKTYKTYSQAVQAAMVEYNRQKKEYELYTSQIS